MRPVITPLEIALQKKRDELSAAKQKYTDSHPDVMRLTNEVATLEQEVASQPTDKPIAVGSSGPKVLCW